MAVKNLHIPVIDLFAGPGGLSEGFSSFAEFYDSELDFLVELSIEKDKIAAETLKLRSFCRQFNQEEIPQCYYDFLRGDDEALEKVKSTPEWEFADSHVWNDALGEIDEKTLHKRIKNVLNGRSNWVLLGGPPCQAYSLIGRARMSGLGHELRSKKSDKKTLAKLRHEKEREFLKDHRHTLYLEYLRIVAVHQPAVFVMENVKGILSSKLPDGFTSDKKPKFKKAFSQIRSDLMAPWKVLKNDEEYSILKSFHEGEEAEYDLYPFVAEATDNLLGAHADKDFLIKSEKHGIPQKRHRVIILGVRKDLKATPSKLSTSNKITVADVIKNLPKLRSGLSKDVDTPTNWYKVLNKCIQKKVIQKLPKQCQTSIQKAQNQKKQDLTRGGRFVEIKETPNTAQNSLLNWLRDDKLGGVINHETRGHMNSDISRYLFVSAMGRVSGVSPKLDDWPSELLPAHKNVFEDGKPKIRDFKDRFKVQVYNEPASTITAHISKDGHYFIHPDPNQCRSFTVREAARIQTFPDNYYFCGNRTQQYQQVGNAVPPYLAVQLANIVAKLLG